MNPAPTGRWRAAPCAPDTDPLPAPAADQDDARPPRDELQRAQDVAERHGFLLTVGRTGYLMRNGKLTVHVGSVADAMAWLRGKRGRSRKKKAVEVTP